MSFIDFKFIVISFMQFLNNILFFFDPQLVGRSSIQISGYRAPHSLGLEL